jgi:hypothetical protein
MELECTPDQADMIAARRDKSAPPSGADDYFGAVCEHGIEISGLAMAQFSIVEHRVTNKALLHAREVVQGLSR